MRKALYGPDGDRLDLAAFVDRQSTDFEKWTVLPICPGCGDRVHPVNIKAVMGFREASKDLLLRTARAKRSTLEPKFSHYDGEGKGCPYSKAKDPFFAPFKNNPFEYREGQRIHAILLEHSAFNGKVFDQLFRTISHGGIMPKEDKRTLWEHTKKIMCSMSLLAHEPWVYPFAQILLMGGLDHTFRTSGKTAVLAFRPVGEQTFRFVDLRGVKKQATVPAEILLSFVNKRKERVTYREYKRDGGTVCFPVSKETALKLGA